MKEANAYRGEYLVIDCPYCGEEHYLDISDDFADGNIPIEGRKMACKKCKKVMLVTEN